MQSLPSWVESDELLLAVLKSLVLIAQLNNGARDYASYVDESFGQFVVCLAQQPIFVRVSSLFWPFTSPPWDRHFCDPPSYIHTQHANAQLLSPSLRFRRVSAGRCGA